MNSEYKLNPINEFCNVENSKLLKNRISEMSVLERIESGSMSQMFSFWREIQEILFSAAEEIKRLNKKIEELENSKNGSNSK
jgi:hypothetical protein